MCLGGVARIQLSMKDVRITMRYYITALLALSACQGRIESIPLPNGDFREAVSSDFNGDGLADIAVITFVDTLQIFLQSEGGFTSQTLPTGAVSVQFLAGDLKGDGDDDLFVVNRDQTINVFNNQTGVFSLQNTLALDSSNGDARTVALGDLDGDQDLDIAATTFVETSPTTSDGRIVLLFQEQGSFTQVVVDVPFVPQAIAIADMDGDQDQDLIFDSVGILQILPNPGDGAFQVDAIITTELILSFSDLLLPVDLDSDGDLDLVSASLSSGDISFSDLETFSNDGGTFSALSQLADDSFKIGSLRSIALADTNGDGRLEILAVFVDENKKDEPVEGKAFVLEIGEFELSVSRRFEVGTAPVTGFLQDFDGDGTLDLFTVNSQSADLSLATDIK
jgi:hypothetical protein